MATAHEVGGAKTTLDQGVLKCGPWANSITITKKLIRHVHPWAPVTSLLYLRSCPRTIGLAPSHGVFAGIEESENLWSG